MGYPSRSTGEMRLGRKEGGMCGRERRLLCGESRVAQWCMSAIDGRATISAWAVSPVCRTQSGQRTCHWVQEEGCLWPTGGMPWRSRGFPPGAPLGQCTLPPQEHPRDMVHILAIPC